METNGLFGIQTKLCFAFQLELSKKWICLLNDCEEFYFFHETIPGSLAFFCGIFADVIRLQDWVFPCLRKLLFLIITGNTQFRKFWKTEKHLTNALKRPIILSILSRTPFHKRNVLSRVIQHFSPFPDTIT